MKELLKLNHLFYRYKGTLALGSLFLVLSNLFLIWIPVLIRQTMDRIEQIAGQRHLTFERAGEVLFSAEAGTLLALNTAYLVGAALLYGVLLFGTRQTIIVASRKIEYDLRNKIYNHLQKLPRSFFDRNKSGDIYTRATEDVVRVREYFGPAFMYTVNTISRTTLIVAIMFMVNARLTAWALLPLPFLAVMAYWVSRYINRRSAEIQQQYALMAGKLQETYGSIRLVKAYNRQEYEKERFFRESARYRRKKLRLDVVEALFHPMLLFLIGISVVLVVWQGGVMVMEGAVTVGNIAEFVIYVNYLTWPVASLGYTLNLLQRSAASNSRIQKLLAVPPETGAEPDTSPPRFEKELVFENVTFTYPGAAQPALKNISMRIRPGERVGVVGRTGSGKTTLVQLIPRLYDPQEGCIRIDGKDIRDYNLSQLRAMIGFVPQDNFLFSDTIGENIGFGKEDATEEEIIKVAEKAEVLENILDFEKKFDTILGERGITLSGGQKQRTSIARALIRKPSVLILDDSLSAVDTRTEDAIIRHLDRDLGNYSMFLICHRLSSLKHVDTIYVLDDAGIVEHGTHGELLERNGFYANMYRKQQLEEELEHI